VTFHDFVANAPNKQAYIDYLAANRDTLIAKACIAHFFLKSDADFKRRIERGVAGQFQGQLLYQQIADDPLRRRELIERTNRIEDHYLRDYWLNYVTALTLGDTW
jgi:hypothetical protein